MDFPLRKRGLKTLVRQGMAVAWMTGCLFLTGCGATGGHIQRQIEFGVESAQKGLWNEAIFRWERSLLDKPLDPLLHNNLAVAYESLGRFEQAEEEYERALELAENRYDAIRQNYEQFMAFYSVIRNQQEGDYATDGS